MNHDHEMTLPRAHWDGNTSAEGAAIAIRSMLYPSPEELSMIIAVLAVKINENGALSDGCRESVIEQLDEIADEIDAEQMEQAK